MSQAYQPLHHKYRPERFDGLVGQEAISTTLKQALKTNRIAPAYLFSGPRGTGKTSSARILARSLNCLKSEEPTTEPCGECSLCKEISSGTSLDVIEIDAASNTGVENIRELIERSRFAPVQARWKVYVVDECHMLSTAAFNALLKTLEEPPPRVVFVLATTDPQRVLPTIVSRCQRFEFRQIPLNALRNHLEMIASKEEIEISPEALQLIAQRAQGGLRDAESMLDQLSLLPQPIKAASVWDLLGTVPEEELIAVVSALSQEEPVTLLETCRGLLDHGRDPIAVLQGLASILRDLVLIKAAPDRPELCNLSHDSHLKLTRIAKSIKPERLLQWQSKLKGTEYQLRQSIQPRLWLEILLLGILAEPYNHSRANINPPQTINNSNLCQVNEEELDKGSVKTTSKPRGQDPETKDLSELWKQILGRLELPSTRMLLSQQGKLIKLTQDKAIVQVSDNWMRMIQSRSNLLEQAIAKTLGSPRQLILEEQSDSSQVKSQIQKKGLERISEQSSQANQIETTSKISHPLESISQTSEIKKSQPEISIENQDISQKTEEIDQKAQQLADFFNGQVLDKDIQN